MGLAPAAALGATVLATLALVLALWPQGVVRSTYMPIAAALVGLGSIAAAAVARAVGRGWAAGSRATFAALVLAVVVQGLFATSPVMVVSDAVFHANNLARVAGGDYWITSQTQHSPPFRFPYGVTFYALLVPFYRMGGDGVVLVRAGAALSGLLASVALAWLCRSRGDTRTGAAVATLQILPVTFDLHSYGNLSNVFGQAMTTVFFGWWADGGPGGWAVGSLAVAMGAIGHFSSFVVLIALAAALLLARRPDLATERWRWISVAVGLGLTFFYYGQFAPMVVRQLPRLGEGGGGESGAAAPLLDVLRQWGLPVVLVAAAGLPRWREKSLDRDLVAYWVAGAALFAVALVSPLDVRYLSRAGDPALGGRRGGRVPALVARVLPAGWRSSRWPWAQVALAGRNLVEAVLWPLPPLDPFGGRFGTRKGSR